MVGNRWMFVGALLAGMGVALGALGAHGLENWLEAAFDDPAEQTKRLANWQTGVRYHLFHAIGIVMIGLSAHRVNPRLANIAGFLMVLGIALFSGCLYGWVLLGSKVLVMVVPLGGVAFIVAWILFAISTIRTGESHRQVTDP